MGRALYPISRAPASLIIEFGRSGQGFRAIADALGVTTLVAGSTVHLQ